MSAAVPPVGSSVPGDTEKGISDEAVWAFGAGAGHSLVGAAFVRVRAGLAAARPLLVSAEAERLAEARALSAELGAAEHLRVDIYEFWQRLDAALNPVSGGQR